MASELRVNTLKDASGNNSIAMSYVAEGTAKAWVNYTGVSTTAARDSFNISSLTDAGTGQTYPISFTNNMGNDDYAGSYFQNSATGTAYTNFSNAYVGGFGTFATGSFGNYSFGSSNDTDSANNYTVIIGDLA
jgi:hypothetical protein